MSTNTNKFFVKISYVGEYSIKGDFNVDLAEAVRIRITNLIEERNISVSKLSTLAGISRSTLSKFLSAKRKMIRLEMIEYICEGLNLSVREFFDDEMFDNIEIED